MTEQQFDQLWAEAEQSKQELQAACQFASQEAQSLTALLREAQAMDRAPSTVTLDGDDFLIAMLILKQSHDPEAQMARLKLEEAFIGHSGLAN